MPSDLMLQSLRKVAEGTRLSEGEAIRPVALQLRRRDLPANRPTVSAVELQPLVEIEIQSTMVRVRQEHALSWYRGTVTLIRIEVSLSPQSTPL